MHDGYWHKGGAGGLIARTILRTLQFLLALVIAILYGIDTRDDPSTCTSQWIFAIVAAVLSMVTVVLHLFITVTRYGWCVWDWVVAVFWAAITGVFGTLYLAGQYKQEGLPPASGRMKVAVWLNLVNMLLWIVTGLLSTIWCCGTRKMRRRIEQDHAKLEQGQLGADGVELERRSTGVPPSYRSGREAS
ncbi:PWWP domain-containing protein2 [Verticillium dahliae VDG2]|nr:PWWP domain-containing protein2 [Verticillium dahliae VDG2]